MAIDIKKLSKLPSGPGFYFFLGRPQRGTGSKKGKEVLYIGKATSLRSRVRSYFLAGAVASRGEKILKLIDEASTVVVEETDSVLEALIKEAAEIKRYQPRYNVLEKSDTSFNYVVITDEAFPRVFTMRERELKTTREKFKKVFGPFPHGKELRDAMKLIRKIFPYRGKTDAPLPKARRRSSTLYEEIGLAPKGAGSKNPKEYQKTIRHLVLFFEGKKKVLVRSLERAMRAYAKERSFEAAAEAKRQLFALRHINDVSLLERTTNDPQQTMRIEAYDIAHTSGTDVVGVMTVVENGAAATQDYRMFKIRGCEDARIRGDKSQGYKDTRIRGDKKTNEANEANAANEARKARFINDTAALKEVLERRFGHPEWPYPKLIVVDGGTAQLRTAQKVLKDFGVRIPVVAVTKNERHRPERIVGDARYVHARAGEILLANSEAHRFAIGFHRRRQRRNLR